MKIKNILKKLRNRGIFNKKTCNKKYLIVKEMGDDNMNFKIGDKVQVKRIVSDRTYNGVYCTEEMSKLKTKVVTIADAFSGDIYKILEDDGHHTWAGTMFNKIEDSKDTKKESSKNENDVAKAIEKLAKELNKRTLYDEVIQDKIVEKAEKVPIEDITNKVISKVENIIEAKYGILPKKIEIVNENSKKEITGIFHKKFEEILNIINKGVPLMLTGPAGAGKNYTLEQVAEALNLDFYFTNAITQEYKLTGFIDANGVYQETQFYKAFKNGGLFFLDEVDASCPESLIILNSAIANKYFDFPNGKVTANENFRVVCAGNTYGTGADMIYVGRNALDGATLDRFAVIEFDYDEDVEKQLAFDNELYQFVKDLRDVINESSLRYIVSMRATINATKLLELGMDKKAIIRSAIIKNMQIDDLNVIIKKLESKNTSDWVKALKGVINDRNKK